MAAPSAATPAPDGAGNGRREIAILGRSQFLNSAHLFAIQLKNGAAPLAAVDPALLAIVVALMLGAAI